MPRDGICPLARTAKQQNGEPSKDMRHSGAQIPNSIAYIPMKHIPNTVTSSYEVMAKTTACAKFTRTGRRRQPEAEQIATFPGEQ
jgi:hypothetical protein